MQDAEFEYLVKVALRPSEERGAVAVKIRRQCELLKLSAVCKQVLDKLLGNARAGSVSHVWFNLVQKEAARRRQMAASDLDAK